ncbi:MAG TPA: BON domain-containing protein [Candidatus Binatia bacterium]
MRGIKMLAACMLFLMAVSGCQSLTGETLGQNIDDTNITAAVKAKLAGEKASTLTRIDVDTVRGVVHLGGVVTTDQDRARAEQIASQVGGVRRVVNDLQVQKR